MESFSNYLDSENKNKMLQLPWQHRSLILRTTNQKFNFNGLIMQLEQIFWKIIIIFCFSLPVFKTNVQQSYLKIYPRLTDV